MELEIDKMGQELFFFFPCNILMELLLPAFCVKIIWFFHILRKENFKFPVRYFFAVSTTILFLDTS